MPSLSTRLAARSVACAPMAASGRGTSHGGQGNAGRTAAPCGVCRITRTPQAVVASCVVAVLLAVDFGINWVLLPVIPWAVGVVMLAACDVRHNIIPKRDTYVTGAGTLAAMVILSAVSHDWTQSGTAVLGGLAAIAILGTLWLAAPRALGFGDVRLAALCAVMVGWFNPLFAVLALAAGQLLCLAALTALAAIGRATRSTHLPLGLFLATANILFVIALGR